MRIENKIKSFIADLEMVQEQDGTYVQESVVKKYIPISFAASEIPFFDLWVNGKIDSCLEVGSLLAYLAASEEIQQIINPPQKEKKQLPKRLSLPTVNVVRVSHDTLDTLMSLFPTEKYDVSYGLTVQLKEILSSFRSYNNNPDLGKGDLSSWLIKSGLFYRTPTGLYTYINKTPLDKLEASTQPQEHSIPVVEDGDIIDQYQMELV